MSMFYAAECGHLIAALQTALIAIDVGASPAIVEHGLRTAVRDHRARCAEHDAALTARIRADPMLTPITTDEE